MLLPLAVVWTLAVPQDPAPERADAYRWQGVVGTVGDGEGARAVVVQNGGLFGFVGLGGPDKRIVKGATAFVEEWFADHPDAEITRVEEIPEFRMTWVWVTDGTANLNVDLVSAGWVRADLEDLIETGRLAVAEAEYEVFRSRVSEAERGALERRAGQWGLEGAEGARLAELGEHAFRAESWTEALKRYREARTAGFHDLWISSRIGDCLQRLGDTKGARRQYEAALGEQSGGAIYYLNLYGAVEEMQRAEGVDAAIAWLEELAAWNPRESSHPRILAEVLASAGRVREAADVAEAAAARYARSIGLQFDATGKPMWDESVVRSDPLGVGAVEVYLLEERAAVFRAEAGDRAAATALRRRSEALGDVVMKNDTSGARLSEVEIAAATTVQALSRLLVSEHPGDRRRAAEEAERRFRGGSLEDEDLAQIARAATVAQRMTPWFASMGSLVEAAWNRGLLDDALIAGYLRGLVGGTEGMVFDLPHLPEGGATQVMFHVALRCSPGITARKPERDDVDLAGAIEVQSIEIDGRSVTLSGASLPASVALDDMFWSTDHLELANRPEPGRHTLRMRGVLKVVGRPRGGGAEAVERIAIDVTTPFFAP